jgi:Histidine kinase-, DNA gyrase B-, and HSP90-like ATPase
VVITVTDHGVGISAEVLPHIFEDFAQSNRSYVRVQGGLGLGLSLSRKFVELHSGKLTASSEGPGRGSRFVVRLPVLPEAPNKASDSDVIPERQADSSKFRIVIVDDNVDSVEDIVLVRLGLIVIWSNPLVPMF